MTESLHKEMLELTRQLQEHNYKYYVLAEPTISDKEFDEKLKRLEILEAKFPELKDPNSPTQKVGGDLTKNFETFEHKRPMFSLGNTYNKEELVEFDNRVQKNLGSNSYEYIAELKFDGLAISLHYKNGVLQKALTRGDGKKGDDVTKNVQTIRTLNTTLIGDFPTDLEVRGEIFMHKAAFKKLNQKRENNGLSKFANPRNCAAGTIKMQDPKVVAQRPLDIFIYHLVAPETNTHWEGIRMLKTWGLKTSSHSKLCENIDELLSFIAFWDKERHQLSYDIDGIVIKVNEVECQHQLGYTSKFPRWAISYKFESEQAITILQKISYQVGRTGAITPVANLKPVNLLGTTVKRASLHNEDFISSMDVRENDVVKIEKGGEIIPKVVAVVTEDRNEHNTFPFQFIQNCPACGGRLNKKTGEAIHYCTNHFCPPQVKGRIAHFASRNAMDIEGLGNETIELLVDRSLVNHFSDLYNLTFDNLYNLTKEIENEDGTYKKISLKEKSVNNLLRGIEKSKEKPFEKVLYGLGIRYVGETVARKLAIAYKNWENLSRANKEELEQTNEIGNKIAESVVAYFSNKGNLEALKELQQSGLQMTYSSTNNQISKKLENQKIVVSGIFEKYSREEIKKYVRMHGGTIQAGVSSNTNFLLAGNSLGPSKLEKAKKFGVKIVSEEQLINMLDG
ncbi:MAG: DNA ligase [Bacteroidetes bacterium MED-G17]|nr:MAG: DNA ligase [Bacteroidetes bacterium MED-G17]